MSKPTFEPSKETLDLAARAIERQKADTRTEAEKIADAAHFMIHGYPRDAQESAREALFTLKSGGESDE